MFCVLLPPLIPALGTKATNGPFSHGFPGDAGAAQAMGELLLLSIFLHFHMHFTMMKYAGAECA